MNPQDKLVIQNWQQAAQTAADSLHVFYSWLKAWECHPMVGSMPGDMFDAVIADLHAAGLGCWADPAKLAALKKVICGGES